jgi:hypothetical protein
VALTLTTMNYHARLMGGANIGATTIIWCWIKGGQSGASTKRYTETPGGAGQLIRARTRHHRRIMVKQEFKTRCEEMKRMGVKPFG